MKTGRPGRSKSSPSQSLCLCIAGVLCSQALLFGQAVRGGTAGLRVVPANAPMPRPPESTIQLGSWSVSQRDAHWQVWTATATQTDPESEQPMELPSVFVEVASGLNYVDDRGQWQPTQERLDTLVDLQSRAESQFPVCGVGHASSGPVRVGRRSRAEL